GVIQVQVQVPVHGDRKFEPDEVFYFQLSNPVHASITTPWVLGTIQNDDVPNGIFVNDVSANEGQVGTTPFTFTISLAHSYTDPITVDYAPGDITALVADNDYYPASGTATIAAGATTTTVTVTVRGDHKVEPNESFSLQLSNPSGAGLF